MELTLENLQSLFTADSEGALNGEILINGEPYYIRKHWSNAGFAVWQKGYENPPIGTFNIAEQEVNFDDGSFFKVNKISK